VSGFILIFSYIHILYSDEIQLSIALSYPLHPLPLELACAFEVGSFVMFIQGIGSCSPMAASLFLLLPPSGLPATAVRFYVHLLGGFLALDTAYEKKKV
jgi:hypothetical protein